MERYGRDQGLVVEFTLTEDQYFLHRLKSDQKIEVYEDHFRGGLSIPRTSGIQLSVGLCIFPCGKATQVTNLVVSHIDQSFTG